MAKRQYSRAAPSQRSRRADPARLVAFSVLQAVSEEDAYANLVLPPSIRRAGLNKRDAGFATELTYGTLRGTGTYDAILSRCVDRDVDQLDRPVLDALRLGSHQLLSMRVTTHAAVNETVGLVRDQIGTGPAGLVNAVLRRVAEKSWDEWLETITSGVGEIDALALRHAHPAWVVRAMHQSLKLHGRPDDLEALLQADNIAPQVHLIGLPGVSGGEASLTAAVEAGAEPSELLDGAAIYSGGDVGLLDGVREGSLRVQDIGSQWVARALAEPAVQPGERWLDLCAGPGGKAALLGSLASEFEVHLTANEPAPHRAKLVEQALSPVDATAWDVRTGDGRTIHELDTSFDRIMVDAPCTGLGALRRRPEARWRRRPSDLASLTALQQQLLDAAADTLAPEGLLAYVTCSPHMAETVVQVQDVLSRRPDLQLLDAHEVMTDLAQPAGADLMTARPTPTDDVGAKCVQLWPHIHGTDAMFFALLQKEPA
ncbi:MAG: RsmB/NOP family class I SAM-dependent RNA methyltransferase [Nesterenkonia sp.]